MLRRTSLHRGDPSNGYAPAPTEEPPQAYQEEPEHQQEEGPGDDDGPELMSDIPMPQAEPAQTAGPDATGKVLGRTRTAAQVPSHFAPYNETIVIGGDPRRAAPPPQMQQNPGEMEQTHAISTPAAPPPPAPDKEIIARAQMEAQQMMQQAQAQAQQMMQEAQGQIQAHAEQVAQQAGQQGFEEGMKQGFAAGQEQGMQETVTRTEQLKMEFVELVLARRKVMAAMEPEIVHLAVNIAEKIVGMELSVGREIITGIVRQGLATLKERDEIVVRVNPAEVDSIKALQPEYEKMIDGLKRFEVLSDGAIEPGSCAIETNLGNVDARISTQLEAVRAGLDEMCKIRGFEMAEKLATEPVEVPDDPEFHARILQAEAEAKAAEAAAKAHH